MKRSRIRQCLVCGEQFAIDRRDRRTCSDKCLGVFRAGLARASNAKRHGTGKRERFNCIGCGVVVDRKWGAHPWRPSFHSRKCYSEWQARRSKARLEAQQLVRESRPARFCSVCECRLIGTQKVCCSRACALARGRALGRAAYVPRPAREVVCLRCSATCRVGGRGNASYRFCASCRPIRARQVKQARRRRCKALARRIESVPYMNADIFLRDGYRCQLCQRKTLRDRVVPHARAPTIDHIVSTSAGGADVPANVQCACFGCNSRRWTRMEGVQYRLAANT